VRHVASTTRRTPQRERRCPDTKPVPRQAGDTPAQGVGIGTVRAGREREGPVVVLLTGCEYAARGKSRDLPWGSCAIRSGVSFGFLDTATRTLLRFDPDGTEHTTTYTLPPQDALSE
jgi:hypothetical protein